MLRICLAFVLLCLPLGAGAGPDGASGTVRVIDADTWEVGPVRVRLFGIDAPEQDQTCRTEHGVPWTCGRWVTDEARDRFEGRHALCERLDTDRYGRMVARCRVDGQDGGRILVSEGLALAYRRYSMDYDLDEKAAAVTDRGLHGANVQNLQVYRQIRRDAAALMAPPADADCTIKGNLSQSTGEAIYHLPGQRDYDKTRISPARGERWFCNEAEARAAGWRPARQ